MKYLVIFGIILYASLSLAQQGNDGKSGTANDPHAGHSHLPGDKEALEHEKRLANEATVNSDTSITIGEITRPAKKYFGNGKLKEESYYLEDKTYAVTKWYYMDGNISAEYAYKNGKIHGLQKTYYFNNILKSESYWENDLQHGPYKEYYKNGKLRKEGVYSKGKKSGFWMEYSEEGKLDSKTKYRKGEALK